MWTSDYPRGTLLWIQAAPDLQARNPKDRPALVIEPFLDHLVCLAITTSFSQGESLRVPLPWARPRHPRTGLWEPCAVACDWFLQVKEADILEKLGTCPGKQLLEVIKIIESM